MVRPALPGCRPVPAEGGGIGLRAGRPPTVTGNRKERATGQARECRAQAAVVNTVPVRSEPGRTDRAYCPGAKCAVMGPGLPERSARHQHLISTSGPRVPSTSSPAGRVLPLAADLGVPPLITSPPYREHPQVVGQRFGDEEGWKLPGYSIRILFPRWGIAADSRSRTCAVTGA
jgi:hypothetical protein